MFLRHISALRPFYEPDKGSAGGDPPADDPAKPRASDILDRHGSDALKLAERLAVREGDNYQLREERRQLKEQLAALQGKLPAEGAIVLAGEDATRWQAYGQLGDVAAIQAALAERDTTKGELATLKRDLELRDVAEVAKYKLSVLRSLAGDAQFVIKEADPASGAGGKRSVVVTDGDKETPLADYAKAKWADFLPALQVEAPRPAIGNDTRRGGGTPPPAVQPSTPKRSIL